jgi:hypothetical protein
MTIRIEQPFQTSAQNLWEIVGVPDRVDWVPGVSECVFDGEVRRLTMPGAGQIAERILARDPEILQLEYSCIESEPPLEHHLARISIKAVDDESSIMIWETEVRPQEFEVFIEKSMQGCLLQIQAIVEAA